MAVFFVSYRQIKNQNTFRIKMKFIIINRYQNYIDANIAKGVLEASGVDSWLQDEFTVTIDPILTNAVGGIKLMTRSEDAEKALSILQQVKEEQQAHLSCPRCGSHQIELVSTPKKPSNWMSVITGLFVNYAAPIDKVNHCFNCGFEFKAT